MSRPVRLPILVCLIACAALAQTTSPESVDVAEARRLLESSSLESRAWGVFEAGLLHEPALQETLVGELRMARELSHAPKDSEEYAYVQALFDALIVTETPVPGDVVLPFCAGRIPECLILLTRSGAEETSLLVLNNLLLKVRSGQFVADMVQGIGATHSFWVYDQKRGWGSGGSNAITAVTGEVVRKFPPRFPPIGVYTLVVSAGTGDVLLMVSRHPVYYRRTVVPAGGYVQWPKMLVGTEIRNWYSIEFLAEADTMDPNVVRETFQAQTFVPWTDLKTLARAREEALSGQAAAIRELVLSAEQAGFGNVPPLRVRIATHFVDVRTKPSDELPVPSEWWFEIK
jgi:hypothetical protein